MNALAPRIDSAKATILIAAAIGTAIVATTAPLAVYATTLAVFGLWHIAAEMNYVVRRFSGRFPRDLWAVWAAILTLLVVVRLNDYFGGGWPGGRSVWEIAALGGLVLSTLRFEAAGADRLRTFLLGGAVAGLAFAAFREPIAALAILAFLHNVTPVGFLLERFDGRERRQVAAISAVVFVVIPIGIVAFLPAFSQISTDAFAQRSFSGLGTIERHFGAFLPPGVVDLPIASRLFACAVYLQCVHYFTVIEILPRLAAPHPAPRRIETKKVAVGITAAVLGLYFASSFPDARRLYGIPAAVHAFLEWPLFVALFFSAKPTAQPAPVPA